MILKTGGTVRLAALVSAQPKLVNSTLEPKTKLKQTNSYCSSDPNLLLSFTPSDLPIFQILL